MNPLTSLELLDIIEKEYNFESPSLRQALKRAKKVEELLGLYIKKDIDKLNKKYEIIIIKARNSHAKCDIPKWTYYRKQLAKIEHQINQLKEELK